MSKDAEDMEDTATLPRHQDAAHRHVYEFYVRFGDIDMRAH